MGLPDLPIEVLEVVCGHLTLRQRVALLSSCRALWARPDVAASGALWGSLDVVSKERELRWRGVKRRKGVGDRRWFTESLRAWLGRRRAAVRRLRLEGLMTEPAALLRSLAGGQLQELRLCENPALGSSHGSHDTAQLGPLGQLACLTRLEASWCELPVLPQELHCLSASLRDLTLAGSSLGRCSDEASLRPLGQLQALTRLDLSSCGLPCVPAALSALTLLSDLNLASNEDLGEDSEDGFGRPLAALRALTHLSLGRCGLLCCPPQLLLLTALRDLGLGENYYLGSGGEAAFQPLQRLASLTRLKLNHCGLESVPSVLGALGSLEDCNLAFNPLGGAGALAPLCQRACGALTRLVLRSCELRALPLQLASLSTLVELDLYNNRPLGRGGEAALEPLQHVGTLQRLDVRCCGLRSLPQQLVAMASRGVRVEWE